MAVTSVTYQSLSQALANAEVDWDSGTIKVALLTSAYTPSQAHDYFNDLTNEVTGTGYVAGGQTLTGKAVSRTAGVTSYRAADTTWTASTISARYAVLYVSTGTASTSPLIGYIDFGETIISSNGPFIIEWDDTAIMQIAS